jgi:hypothetical protein
MFHGDTHLLDGKITQLRKIRSSGTSDNANAANQDMMQDLPE